MLKEPLVPEEARLLEILRRVGYGRIVRIDVRDGVPLKVVAEVDFDLTKELGSRLQALPVDKHTG